MEGGKDTATPTPLHLFKTELASVLENNAAKLLQNRNDKFSDPALDSKVHSRKASQNSLVRLFSSRSQSSTTIHSSKSEQTSQDQDGKTSTESTQSIDKLTNETLNDIQKRGADYVSISKNQSSSDTDDSDIHYSKLPSNLRSRFFVALPVMTKSREKALDEVRAVTTSTPVLNSSELNHDTVDATRNRDFVRNVKGFGSQLRKSFFKRKSVQSIDKLGPLKQIRSDDESSESDPEDVTVFEPRVATQGLESKLSASETPILEIPKMSSVSEAPPKKENKSQKKSKKEKKSLSEAVLAETEAAAETSGNKSSKKNATSKESKLSSKNSSKFYGESVPPEVVPEEMAENREDALRQYFEEALGTGDLSKSAKRRHFHWFSRRRKPEVVVTAKCSVDVGTQFPEVGTAKLDVVESLSTEQAALSNTLISQEELWKVPREPIGEVEEEDKSEMIFRCSSSHNEFPVHEPDYVPGDSELTLSSLDVTDKVNTVATPTYYGSNPKPARIPIFSACCPARGADLSVPYVKPSKEVPRSKSPKLPGDSTETRDRNPAYALVKTMAKQVVDKLREREKRKRKTETTFYSSPLPAQRRWNSCRDLNRASTSYSPSNVFARRKSF